MWPSFPQPLLCPRVTFDLSHARASRDSWANGVVWKANAILLYLYESLWEEGSVRNHGDSLANSTKLQCNSRLT